MSQLRCLGFGFWKLLVFRYLEQMFPSNTHFSVRYFSVGLMCANHLFWADSSGQRHSFLPCWLCKSDTFVIPIKSLQSPGMEQSVETMLVCHQSSKVSHLCVFVTHFSVGSILKPLFLRGFRAFAYIYCHMLCIWKNTGPAASMATHDLLIFSFELAGI